MALGKMGAKGGFGSLGGVGGRATPAQATAFYARLSVQPTATKKAQYNGLISGLVSAGIWAKIDGLYILSTDAVTGVAADAQAIAFTNLKSSSFGLTKVGTGNFARNIGWQGNGSTGYLDSGFTPSTAGGNYTQNSAHLGVTVSNDRKLRFAFQDIGTSKALTVFDYIIPYWTDGNVLAEISAGTQTPFASTGTAGTWVVSRTASNLTTVYKNGTQGGTDSAASIDISNNSIVVGVGRGNNGALQNFSQDIISAAFFGGALTASDVSTISSLLATITSSSTPFLASFYGLNQTFAENFASTGLANIDVNNTKSNGFNWYVAPYFGASVPASGDFTFASNLVSIKAGTNNSSYRSRIHTRGNTSAYVQGTIAGSVLTVNSVAGGVVAAGQVLAGANITAGALTIVSQASGGAGGAGTYNLSGSATVSVAQSIVCQSSVGLATFAPGGYFEAKFTFNPNLTTGSQTGGWPAFWMQDIAVLYAQNLTTTYSTASHGFELDIFEALPIGASSITHLFSLHDWTTTVGGGFGSNNQNTNNDGSAVTGTPNYQQVHSFAAMWRTQAQTGGAGTIQRYLDGVRLTSLDVSYSTGGTASPGASPSNPAGTFSISESGQYVIMFDGGFEMGINLQSIQVWQ